MEGQEDIFVAILDNFNEVYSAEPCEGISECLQNIQPKVTLEMNSALMVQVSDAEIKMVVDSLGATKALGPDGLNGLFYQNHWEIVKEEVCKAVKGFFQGENFPTEINETEVALDQKLHSLNPFTN